MTYKNLGQFNREKTAHLRRASLSSIYKHISVFLDEVQNTKNMKSYKYLEEKTMEGMHESLLQI